MPYVHSGKRSFSPVYTYVYHLILFELSGRSPMITLVIVWSDFHLVIVWSDDGDCLIPSAAPELLPARTLQSGKITLHRERVSKFSKIFHIETEGREEACPVCSAPEERREEAGPVGSVPEERRGDAGPVCSVLEDGRGESLSGLLRTGRPQTCGRKL